MASSPNQNSQQKKNSAPEYLINRAIRAKTVRIVGENIEPRIVTIQEAMRLAEEMELDLVEISPQADPPVCKIMDYQKFLYQQRKNQNEMKAKAVMVGIK
jgi:translation initiation factor IF-3